MKRFSLFLVATLWSVSFVIAQKQPRVSKGVDIGSGFKSTSWAPSMLYHQELGFRRFPFLQFSAGIRSWGYYAGATNLVSQSGNVLPDTLQFRNVSSNGLSIVTGINLKVWKLDVGVNTDLLGFALGSERNAFYPKNIVNEGQGGAFYNNWVPASPIMFNALPGFLKDMNGQSEFYARVWISQRLGFKAGYLYGQLAYHTGRSEDEIVLLDHGHKRFSANYGMPYAAISFLISE